METQLCLRPSLHVSISMSTLASCVMFHAYRPCITPARRLLVNLTPQPHNLTPQPQAALPFKTKPKLEPARSGKRKSLEQKRAVVLEAHVSGGLVACLRALLRVVPVGI